MPKYIIKNLDPTTGVTIKIYSLDDVPTSVFSDDFTRLTETDKAYGINLMPNIPDATTPVSDFAASFEMTEDGVNSVLVDGAIYNVENEQEMIDVLNQHGVEAYGFERWVSE